MNECHNRTRDRDPYETNNAAVDASRKPLYAPLLVSGGHSHSVVNRSSSPVKQLECTRTYTMRVGRIKASIIQHATCTERIGGIKLRIEWAEVLALLDRVRVR